MFGRNKPVVFEPYGRRRSRGGLPRWLWLLLLGAAAGAGGVIWLQMRVLPPRLSADESSQLRQRFDEADAARGRLAAELEGVRHQLDAATAEKAKLDTALGASRQEAESLRADVASLVQALPPDPREGQGVQVRAGRFATQGRALDYDLVLTRERSAGKPFNAVLQLVVTGEGGEGGSGTVRAKPVPVSIQGHEVVHGRIDLPQGFKARQTTVQVLEREAGKLLGMRVLRVD